MMTVFGLCSYNVLVGYKVMTGMVIMDDELGRMLKEVILAHFKVLLQYLVGGIGKSHKILASRWLVPTQRKGF
jgi:hypothetical protein